MLNARLLSQRLRFMAGLAKSSFSRGWSRRIAHRMEAEIALDPVTALLDVGGKVIDRLWPDPMQAAQAKLDLIKLQQSVDLAQIAGQLEFSKVAAANPKPFTSCWRPFVGWTCGAGFTVQFVVGPVGEWISALAGHPVKCPHMGLSTMMPSHFEMLGLEAYRTAVKLRGVTK
jgi:hypothetical protein